MEPPVRIAVESCTPEAGDGQWRVTWLIYNDSSVPLWIDEAWVPHGRFRGVAGHVPIGEAISPGSAHLLALSVSSAEPAASVVENAFLIARLRDAEHAWRVFARMRVEFDAQAIPMPIVETLTMQSIQ